tara:strand:- start:3036 stop:3275 length:240 start_codon:yes stop_codon:yes gene_type:complete
MTEAAIKKLGFQKVKTEDDLYYYSYSIAGMDFFSVGNDQVEGKDWYVEFICPGTHQAGIRFYNSRDLKSVITILERNKI